jgi:hypothetical protein
MCVNTPQTTDTDRLAALFVWLVLLEANAKMPLEEAALVAGT